MVGEELVGGLSKFVGGLSKMVCVSKVVLVKLIDEK